MDPAREYAADILSDKIPSCHWTKKGCERFLADLKRSGTKPFPYRFDLEKGMRVVRFLEMLVLTKGPKAGEKMILPAWQIFIVLNIYGWVHKTTGLRRFQIAYISVARKNSKSTLLAGLLLWAAMEESSAEAYTVATTRDQAKISWTQAKEFVQKTPGLSELLQIKHNNIYYPEGLSKIVPLASTEDRLDGLNTSFCCLDEFHAHPNGELRNVIRSSMDARSQPLLIEITTAGFNLDCACYAEEQYVKNLLSGNAVNDSFFALIYTLDDADDWKDFSTWVKANPNMDVSFSQALLRNQFTEALSSASKENEFLVKRLNLWRTVSTRWIPTEKYFPNVNRSLREEALVGRPCYLATDLSLTTDLTAYGFVFPPQEPLEKPKALLRYFIPSETLDERQRRESALYLDWVSRADVTLCPGPTIDYAMVADRIRDDLEKFKVLEFTGDPWKANEINRRLENLGLEFVPFAQTSKMLSPALKELEKAILGAELEIFDNGITHWCMSNAQISYDKNENLKIDKSSRTNRIDGVLVLTMAFYRYKAHALDAPPNNDFSVEFF